MNPEPVIREGEAVPEILSQIEENGEIRLFALGTSPDKGGPGSFVTALSQRLGSLPVPLAIIHGGPSKERLGQLR